MGLVLSSGGSMPDPRATQEFVTFARERGIDLLATRVAQQQDRLVSAIFPLISPGRTMLLMVPSHIADPAMVTATRQLATAVCSHGKTLGVHLAQCLIDPSDRIARELLESAGFKSLAELLYLHVYPPAAPPRPTLAQGQAWLEYSSAAHHLFGRTVLASYRGSLDCPGLNGLRDIEDILAGHKASGVFDPANWRVLLENDQPVAVLLLNQSARGETLELVYVGIIPEARGRKLGDLLVRQALWATSHAQLERLCLAVDSLNVPAIKLYYRHGMQRIGSKLAMLRDLRG